VVGSVTGSAIGNVGGGGHFFSGQSHWHFATGGLGGTITLGSVSWLAHESKPPTESNMANLPNHKKGFLLFNGTQLN